MLRVPRWSMLTKTSLLSIFAPGKASPPLSISAFTRTPHASFLPKRRPMSMYSPAVDRPENTCVYFVIGVFVARFVTTLIVPGAGVAPLFVPLFDMLTPLTAAFGPEVISMRPMICAGGVVNW